MVDLTLAGANNNSGLARPIQSYNPADISLAGGNVPGMGSQDSLNLGMSTGPGGGFDWSKAMDGFSMGAQGVMGLANAYTAYKQLGLMEDQLSMQKGIANRNIANQAATTNRMLEDRASMAAQMTSGAEYGTPEHLKAKKELQTTVSGEPIA